MSNNNDWKTFLARRMDIVLESKHEMMGIKEPLHPIKIGDYTLLIGEYDDWKFPSEQIIHKILADEDFLVAIMDIMLGERYHRFLIGGIRQKESTYVLNIFHEMWHPDD